MAQQNIKPEDAFKWVLYGTGAYAIYKIGMAIGLFKSSEEKAFDKFSENKGWDPFFWQDMLDQMKKKGGKASIKILNKDLQSKYAKQLYDAEGTFNDDENAVYDVFRNMHNLTSLSILCYVFSQTYSESLYDYLTGFLSDSEMRNIYDIVKNYKIGYSLDGTNWN
jgi:hypothetical protein